MADFESVSINGTAEQLEKLLNMDIVESISEDSGDNEIPTAGAVFGFLNGQGAGGSVSYLPQELEDGQKAQARENIGAATIDNTKVGADAWSSKNTVDKLCPSFTESGTVVVCEPVEGYPLEVVSKIVPKQDGSGDPSPDNVRPISGHSAVNLTNTNGTDTQEFTFDLGQSIYGGSLDWATGVLTVGWGETILDEKCNWNFSVGTGKIQAICKNTIAIPASAAYCDKFPWGGSSSGLTNRFYIGGDFNFYTDYFSTSEEWRAFVKATPLHVVYQLAEPFTIQLTAQEILALAGVNTLYSDTGDTEVTGKANPSAIFEKLTNAIIALGGNV